MHAHELVELAALVAAHGPTLIHADAVISDSAIEEYWAASKCRLDRWAQRLHALPKRTEHASDDQCETSWASDRAVLEEIFTGELLTRTLAAVAAAYDRRRGTDRIDPIARSILLAHLEARNRALHCLVRDAGIPAEEALRLNQLRRRTERWIDLLVGLVADEKDFPRLAIDAQRARDFAEDLHYRRRLRGAQHAWPLLQVSLRATFRRSLSPESPSGELNARIATAVLSCFPSTLFDSTGAFRSLWMVRLAHGADDAQLMMNDLLASAESADPVEPSDSLLTRLRRFGTC